MLRSRTTTALLGLGIALSLATACSSTSARTESSVATAVSVTIVGGLETVAGDNGRPIVLVAGLLGVAPAVFRTAFSGVTPADPALGPTTAEAQRNKSALLSVLSPYGITNAELD